MKPPDGGHFQTFIKYTNSHCSHNGDETETALLATNGHPFNRSLTYILGAGLLLTSKATFGSFL